jgi:hypothetical protein
VLKESFAFGEGHGQSFENFLEGEALLWHYTRECVRICKKRSKQPEINSKQSSSLTFLQGFLHHSIAAKFQPGTPTSFQHKTNIFVSINS